MQFRLKPTVRQLSLAFPALLIAVPLAMNAAEDKPGAALPPPSLYDAPLTPSQAPSVSPAPTTPAVSVAPAAKPAPAPATPAPAPVAAKPAPAPVLQEAAAPTSPWYKRWFPFLFTEKTSTAKPIQHPPTIAQIADRGQYAYDSPSHTIRSGFTGECVRTGWWSEGTATADCDPQVVARRHQPVHVAAVAAVPKPMPVTVAAGSAPAPARVAAGSAPAPMPVAVRKAEPVEVVPLPPAPPAAKEEHVLAPDAAKDEPITALAETHMMSEPEFDKITLSAGALFPLSSSTIKPLGREKLDELVAKLKGVDFDAVRVVGYTDPTGAAPMNEKLSKNRADAVKRYLMSKGVDGNRIETEGRGGADPQPKPQNCDALPRMEKIICYAPDRRVEIEVVGGKPRG